jgi:hypothetical protein
MVGPKEWNTKLLVGPNEWNMKLLVSPKEWNTKLLAGPKEWNKKSPLSWLRNSESFVTDLGNLACSKSLKIN